MTLSAAHNPDVVGFFDPATHTVTYLVADTATGSAAIIDPVLDYDPAAARTSTGSIDRVLDAVRDRGLTLERVLETHAHADHLTGADAIRTRTGAPIGIGEKITKVQKTFADLFEAADVTPDAAVFDETYADGARFKLGDLDVEVMHTPGHTPACVAYRIGDAGGDARTLYRSIQKILALPEATRVFVGHDYLPKDGRTDFRWATTVGDEKTANIHIAGQTEDDFVAMREARDATLPPPQLILPALQVNIRAGALPPAEASGKRFLKLPLNAI